MLKHVLKTLSGHSAFDAKDVVTPISGSVLVCNLTLVPNFIFGVTGRR